MTQEQLKTFIEKAKSDDRPQEMLNVALDADAVVAVARETGFSISEDELIKAESEVTEDELCGVSWGGETRFEKGLVKYAFYGVDIFALPSAFKTFLTAKP